MRTIITINESMSMRGRYSYSIKRPNVRAQLDCNCGHGPHAAAAKAVDLAMSCDDFVILANKKVMELLPDGFT